jgi:hypothetical protein
MYPNNILLLLLYILADLLRRFPLPDVKFHGKIIQNSDLEK